MERIQPSSDPHCDVSGGKRKKLEKIAYYEKITNFNSSGAQDCTLFSFPQSTLLVLPSSFLLVSLFFSECFLFYLGSTHVSCCGGWTPERSVNVEQSIDQINKPLAVRAEEEK